MSYMPNDLQAFRTLMHYAANMYEGAAHKERAMGANALGDGYDAMAKQYRALANATPRDLCEIAGSVYAGYAAWDRAADVVHDAIHDTIYEMGECARVTAAVAAAIDAARIATAVRYREEAPRA